MAEQSKAILKGYFNTGDVPSEAQFEDLIDSFPQVGVTPTLEELTASTYYYADIAISTAVGLWIAPFPCKIVWFGMIVMSGNVVASDITYWTVQLRRIRNDATALIATKTTKATGGEGIAQRTYWSMDGVTFDAANQILALGDAVDVRYVINGGVAAVSTPLFCIRYEPI